MVSILRHSTLVMLRKMINIVFLVRFAVVLIISCLFTTNSLRFKIDVGSSGCMLTGKNSFDL